MCTGATCCIAGNLCSCLGDGIGQSLKEQIRLSYISITLGVFLILTILQTWFLDILNFFTNVDFLGVSAVYRLSMALMILHIFVLFCCSMRNEFGKDVNEKAWCLKILGIVVLFVIMLQISNDTFEFYSDIAKFVGGFFLLFQIIVIIDLFYLWGEKWRDIYDGEEYQNPENSKKESNTCWGVVMLITSIVLYAGVGYF